jgi:hypothetical protein
MTASHLSPRDAALGLLIVFFWGINFVVVRWGLGMLPPLLMAAIRFALVLFPAILFLKRPNISWGSLALYGLCVGTGQFGLLYIAMNGFISPGMASLVMQMQVFFTIAVAAQRSGDKPRMHQLLGLAPAVAGVALILKHNGEDITPAGLALVLGGDVLGDQQPDYARSRTHSGRARHSAEPAGLCCLGQPVRHAGASGGVAPAGRPGSGFPGRVRFRLDDLAYPGVAERGQYPVRLHDVGLAAVALSSRDGRAHVAAGAGVRHRSLGPGAA